MPHNSEALNIKQALSILRRRAVLIVFCAVVVAGAAFGFSKSKTKKYTAVAAIAFSTNPLSQEVAGLPASGSTSSGLLAEQASDLELVKLGDMAATTASLLGHGLTAGEVRESVSVAGQGESGVVSVSATTTSPALAASIANTYGRQAVAEAQNSNRQFFQSALVLVRKQLAALSHAQRISTDGLALQEREQSLVLLSELQQDNVQLAQEALVPSSPSSPKTKEDTLVGGVLGLLIGIGFAFLLEALDRRIKAPEDLKEIYGLPLLGAVPESAALSRSARTRGDGRAVLPSVEAEAFSLIRAHLRFFNIDRELRTVLIASAAPGDGKTTIARHLAEAAARLGSQVLVLEVDLRHPTLARQLDVQTGPGLADVLIGATSFTAAAQTVVLEAPPGEGAKGRTLDVLVAGGVLPPNPGELLESEAMGAVLEQAKSRYDLVVIDTPPLTAVSDAFPLLTKVDGVVIVGWVGHSRRDAAERLHQVLSSSGSPLLGVIANGSSSGAPAPYPGDGKASSSVTSAIGSSSSADESVPAVNA